MPFNEFYNISQGSLKVIVDKYVANISLTNEYIKHIEYSTRGQKSSNLWWKYIKEKLAASNFYIAAVNKVEPSKRIESCNESLALTQYVTLSTTQSVTVNLVQPRLIKITSFCCDIT